MADPPSHQPYSYDYCPLNDPSEDLRILKITLTTSNSHEDKVEGQLVQLEEDIPYAALSWCWGSRVLPKKALRITHDDRPYDFEISATLESALKQLRRYKVEYIWIDQICINQSNISERNNQVRQMAKIYSHAEKVYVWLGEQKEGEDGGDSEMAFRFIDTQVLQLRYFDNLVKNQDLHKDWNNMVEMLKRAWFSRRWIVQEIALARDAVIICGPHSINWVDFADAVSLFNDAEAEKQTISRAIMMEKKEYGHEPRYFGYVPALSATRLVQVTNDLFRRRADHEKVALLSLEQLVSTFTAFNASEPRDTIYAVLAIAKDTVPRTSHFNMRNMVSSYNQKIQERFIEQLAKKIVAKSYYVNYNQPVSDVFVDFVDFAISQSDKSRALDIICRPWAPSPSTDGAEMDHDLPCRAIFDEAVSKRDDELGRDSLPSWIPSIEGAAYGLEPRTKRMVRKNADTLVGVPPQRNYAAAGDLPVAKSLRFEQGITQHSDYQTLNGVHYHSMFVEGFVVDRIDRIGTASQQGNIPRDWTRLARRCAHEDEQFQKLPDVYWRTLVADRGKSGNPPRHYPRVINHALESHVNGTFNTQRAIDHPDSETVRDVLERVQAVIWNRHLVLTADGRLSLVPETAAKGDFIAVLYGCSVPVVLRRFTKTRAEVEGEARTKITRRHKMAARKIVEVWRQIMARRREQRDGRPLPPRRPRPAELPGTSAPQASTSGVVAGEGSGGRRGAEHASAAAPPPQTGGREADQETKPEETFRMPGSWYDPPAARPSLSRKSTTTNDIVAPGPTLPQSVALPSVSRTSLTLSSSTAGPAAPAEAASNHNKASDPSQQQQQQQQQQQIPKSDKYTFYQLVGECYLHGMMNGEAIPLQRSAEEGAKKKGWRGDGDGDDNDETKRLREMKSLGAGEGQEYIVKIHRRMTMPPSPAGAPSSSGAKVKARGGGEEEGPGEVDIFRRTLFEIR